MLRFIHALLLMACMILPDAPGASALEPDPAPMSIETDQVSARQPVEPHPPHRFVQRVQCGSAPTAEQLAVYREEAQQTQAVPKSTTNYFIPLRMHVITRANGTGGATDAQIDEAVRTANLAFLPHGIQFYVLEPRPRIPSDDFYQIDGNNELSALWSLNQDLSAINCFIVEDITRNGESFCGIASLPPVSTANFPPQGVSVARDCLGTPWNPTTLAHELGHYLGLLHTHEPIDGCLADGGCQRVFGGLVNPPQSCGDFVADTPPDPDLSIEGLMNGCTYVGTITGPCAGDPPYAPNPRNIMSYAPPTCRDLFTPGQGARMRGYLGNVRVDRRYELVSFRAGNPACASPQWQQAWDNALGAWSISGGSGVDSVVTTTDQSTGTIWMLRSLAMGFSQSSGLQRMDLWSFDGRVWKSHSTAGLPIVLDPAMAWNPNTGTLLVFGGQDGTLQRRWTNALHELRDGVWFELDDGINQPDPYPPALQNPQMAFDVAAQRMILVAGSSSGASDQTNNRWWYRDASNWWTLSSYPVHGQSYSSARLLYDRSRGEMMLIARGRVDSTSTQAVTWGKNLDRGCYCWTGPWGSTVSQSIVEVGHDRATGLSIGLSNQGEAFTLMGGTAGSITRSPELDLPSTIGGLGGEAGTMAYHPYRRRLMVFTSPLPGAPGGSRAVWELRNQPRILREPLSASVWPGGVINLTVEMEPQPLGVVPSVQWYKDDQLLSAGGRVQRSSSGMVYSLSISGATSGDEGVYHAVVTTACGWTETARATVRVNTPLVWERTWEFNSVLDSDDTVFTQMRNLATFDPRARRLVRLSLGYSSTGGLNTQLNHEWWYDGRWSLSGRSPPLAFSLGSRLSYDGSATFAGRGLVLGANDVPNGAWTTTWFQDPSGTWSHPTSFGEPVPAVGANQFTGSIVAFDSARMTSVLHDLSQPSGNGSRATRTHVLTSTGWINPDGARSAASTDGVDVIAWDAARNTAVGISVFGVTVGGGPVLSITEFAGGESFLVLQRRNLMASTRLATPARAVQVDSAGYDASRRVVLMRLRFSQLTGSGSWYEYWDYDGYQVRPTPTLGESFPVPEAEALIWDESRRAMIALTDGYVGSGASVASTGTWIGTTGPRAHARPSNATSRSAPAGTSIMLTAPIEQDLQTHMDVRWRRNGSDLVDDGTRYLGANSRTLTLLNLREEQEGLYDYRVTQRADGATRLSGQTNVRVEPPTGPWVRRQPGGPGGVHELTSGSMYFDTRRQRVRYFGHLGSGATLQNQLWEWDGAAGTWSRISLGTGLQPPPVSSPDVEYHPIAGCLVVHGGTRGDNTPLAETWCFDGQQWWRAASGVTGLTGTAAATGWRLGFDPGAGVPVLVRDNQSEPRDSGTWELRDVVAGSENQWTRVQTGGPQLAASGMNIVWMGAGPGGRLTALVRYTASSSGQPSRPMLQAWVRQQGVWTLAAEIQRALEFGGQDRYTHMDTDRGVLAYYESQTGQPTSVYEFDGHGWSSRDTPALPASISVPVAFDVARREAVLFSRSTSPGNPSAGTWVRPSTSAPLLAAQPEPRTVNYGSTITMSATPASGLVGLAARWQRNGQDLIDGPGGASPGGGTVNGASPVIASPSDGQPVTLTIIGARPGDAGLYTLRLDNASGTAISQPAQLTVVDFPIITAQPQHVQSCPGGSAEFFVGVDAISPPTYRWRRDGVELADGAGVSGATQARLNLSGAALVPGTYDVLVTANATSITSAGAALTLREPLVITQQPSNVSLCFGERATLGLGVSGDGPLTFTWERNGVIVSETTQPQLVIAALSAGDLGMYRVIVAGPCNALGSATFTVAGEGAQITTPPASRSACVGSAATFSVVAAGRAPLSYQWLRAGTPISGATGSSYTIAEASPADAGSYTVRVTGGCGDTVEASAFLTVNTPTTIVTAPRATEVIAGQAATLTVVAQGSNLSYTWRRNGTIIQGLPASTSSLSIPAATDADAGLYRVTVNGLCGSITTQDVPVVVRCTSRWLPGQSSLGPYNTARSLLITGDDRLIVAGEFFTVGGIPARGIAQWDGKTWSAIGGSLNGPAFAAITLGNDIVAGGQFSLAGGVPANGVARWDGSTWSPLGAGFSSGVNTLVVHNGELIAGGAFSSSGGAPTLRVARWTGTTWLQLGAGFNSTVSALLSTPDGLVAAGAFGGTGAAPVLRVARWDGAQWSAMGSGFTAQPSGLAQDPQGLTLAFGVPLLDGVGPSSTLVAWQAGAWVPVAPPIADLVSIDSAQTIQGDFVVGYTAGPTNSRRYGVAKRTSTGQWQLIPGEMGVSLVTPSTPPQVRALGHWRGRPIIAGSFGTAGGVIVDRLATLTPAGWRSIAPGLNNPASVMLTYRGLVYAAGTFNAAGETLLGPVAQWNGRDWSPTGQGLGGRASLLSAEGNQLFAAGSLQAGTLAASVLAARLDLAQPSPTWQALSPELTGTPTAMAVLGNEPVLAGSLTLAGQANPPRVVRHWPGGWQPMDAGLVTNVTRLFARAAPTGTELWAGLAGSAGLARWDGSQWITRADITGNIWALHAHEGALVVAGQLTIQTTSGPVSTTVARLDGDSFTPLGTGSNRLLAQSANITLLSDGATLLAAGTFILPGGGSSTSAVALWTGTNWRLVSTPTLNFPATAAAALGGEVLISGSFNSLGGQPSEFFARLTLRDEPWFVQQPTVVQSGPTSLLRAVLARGYERTQYRWRRNAVSVVDGPGGAAPGGGTVQGASGSLTSTDDNNGELSLRIDGAQPQVDAGIYDLQLTHACGTSTSASVNLFDVPTPCGPADIAGQGQSIGPDGALTADDIIVFIGWFFTSDVRADIAGQGQTVGADGTFTGDDIILFINRFFAGC